MKRPTKQAVRAMVREEVRFNPGANRLNEAVELRSGILVVEYTYTSKFHTEKGYSYQRKVVLKPWWDRAPITHVIESGYVEELPTRRK